MTADLGLDRRLERWFVEDAPAHAPDRVLAVAMDLVDHTTQDRRLGVRVARRWGGLTSRQRFLLAAATLLLAFAATAAVGAIVLRLIAEDGPAAILVRSLDGGSPAEVIAVVERHADGSETELARYTAEQLGGPVPLWMAGPVLSPFDHLALPISSEDGLNATVVVDLRGDGPVQYSDISGAYAAFGPDGVLGFSTRDGLGVHDPFTGVSRSTGIPESNNEPWHAPIAPDGLVTWTADGSGVLADGGAYASEPDATIPAIVMGTLRRDGTFVAGTVPLVYDGVGARRVDAAGALLRCGGVYDWCDTTERPITAVTNGVTTTVWTNPGTDRHVSDLAWAVDGGLWLLLESAADGPREVSLVRVAPNGVETVVTSFDGPAHLPDAYFPAASFDAMAPDDSALVVRIAGDEGSPGSSWLVRPSTGTREPLDGVVAGWRLPDATERTRPGGAPTVPTDAAIRDVWADGEVAIAIGATSIDLSPRGTPDRLVVASAGQDEISVSGATRLDCAVDAAGRYRWVVIGGRLTLTAADEPCGARASMLERTFDRSLPLLADGPARVSSGETYRAFAFAEPFVVSIPSMRGDTVDVWRHNETIVEITRAIPNGDARANIFVMAPLYGSSDPCQRSSDNHDALAPGVDGVLAYLEEHELLPADRGSAIVDGHPARTFTLHPPVGCEELGLALFGRGAGSAEGIGDGRRFLVFELDDGTPIVIVGRSDPADTEATAWMQALIDSIRFDR